MSVPARPRRHDPSHRLTVAQALVRFFAAQFSERDGTSHRLIPGAFGIFGHGNVAGVGQTLLQNALDPCESENPMPYYLKRPGFRSESQQGESEHAQEVQSRAA